MFAPSVMYAARRASDEAGPASPTTVAKYAMASSNESGTPSACISGLLGSQRTPPEIAVEPPSRASFSITSVSRPLAAAVTAPHRPPPDPTTTTSVVYSGSDTVTSLRW